MSEMWNYRSIFVFAPLSLSISHYLSHTQTLSLSFSNTPSLPLSLSLSLTERKGISDLFQSFASGRLYNQAESMGKHYLHPCLLIEFHPDKSFNLQVSKRII